MDATHKKEDTECYHATTVLTFPDPKHENHGNYRGNCSNYRVIHNQVLPWVANLLTILLVVSMWRTVLHTCSRNDKVPFDAVATPTAHPVVVSFHTPPMLVLDKRRQRREVNHDEATDIIQTLDDDKDYLSVLTEDNSWPADNGLGDDDVSKSGNELIGKLGYYCFLIERVWDCGMDGLMKILLINMRCCIRVIGKRTQNLLCSYE